MPTLFPPLPSRFQCLLITPSNAPKILKRTNVNLKRFDSLLNNFTIQDTRANENHPHNLLFHAQNPSVSPCLYGEKLPSKNSAHNQLFKCPHFPSVLPTFKKSPSYMAQPSMPLDKDAAKPRIVG